MIKKIQKMKSLKGIKEAEREFRERIITLILAGFGLVAALAWNDAIQNLFNVLFPKGSSGLIGKFIYAFIVTVILAIISLQLKKISEKKAE